MKCPKCKREIIEDSAGTKLWHCTKCQYAWKLDELKGYWKALEEHQLDAVVSLPTCIVVPNLKRETTKYIAWTINKKLQCVSGCVFDDKEQALKNAKKTRKKLRSN